MKYFSLILLTAYLGFSSIVQAQSQIPMPLEAINKILDKKFPKKTNQIDRDSTGFPPIISDINSLSSRDRNARSKAYKRLIARGDEVSPVIILRVADAETSLSEKKRLIHLLGLIKAPGTDKDIIAFTEMLRKLDKDVRKLKLKIVYSQAFRSLSKYSDTSAAIDYADKLLNDKNIASAIHAQALFFLSDQNAQDAEKWVKIYNNSASIDVQYALKYLVVKIGAKSGIQEAIKFLVNLPESQNNYKYETHKLLENLPHTVDADELRTIISAIKKKNGRFIADKRINSYPLLSDLYNEGSRDRSKAALLLLNGWRSDKKSTLESLKYMISINDAEPYINLWKLHHPVLMRAVIHLGYIISFDGNLASFIETPAFYSYQTPKPALLVEALIDSFKNNDINSFKSSLLPDKNTFKSINQDMQSNRKNSNSDELHGKFKAYAIGSWSDIIKKSSLADIDWANVKYKSENRILVGINGTHISKIIVYIEENNKKYKITLEDCILFNNKWYVLSGMKWS